MATFGDVRTPTSDHELAVRTLVGRASAELLNPDPTGYLALFAQAATLPRHRRYQASRLLLERGLTATHSHSGRRLVESLVVLAGAVVDLLESEPAEPVLLNYAGVIFYELWGLDAAKALFLAARRLDPELAHLDANLANVRQRKQSVGRELKGRRATFMHPALPELSRRALRVAPKAQPARGLRMSLCMIVKNEEEMLGRCLAAAAPAVDEIIVVDTGSTDRTIEIAHEYGALVIEREWTGSFSDARNVSFEAATGDWVIYLDADQILVGDDVANLRALTGQTWREAFFIHETNHTGHEESGVSVIHAPLRVFRNRPEYRFSGRLHEQIAPTLPTYLEERVRYAPVRVDHYGYLSSVRASKAKSSRNLELLLQARAEGVIPEAFDHFNLGMEYFALDNAADASAEFEQAWAMATGPNGSGGHFVPTLAGRMLNALREAGRSELAIERAEEALALFPDFTDLLYQQGLAAMGLGRRDAAVSCFQRCIEMGDAPARYTAVVGSGTFMPRISLAIIHMREEDYAEALELLRWCAVNHPNFFGTYRAYLTALLASGVDPSAAVAEIEAIIGDTATSMIHFTLATVLIERNAISEATRQLRTVTARRPDNVPASELLLETLLMTQDFESFGVELERFSGLELPERDRRERLAQMYMRHGFLRSAAREWMAVIDVEPDAAAMNGLAEVARRHGQAETAEAFSAEALKFPSK